MPTDAELSGAAAIPVLGACGSTMDAREPTWNAGRPPAEDGGVPGCCGACAAALRKRTWHREKYPGCKRSLPPLAAPQKQSRGSQPRLGYLAARANCFALSWDEADARLRSSRCEGFWLSERLHGAQLVQQGQPAEAPQKERVGMVVSVSCRTPGRLVPSLVQQPKGRGAIEGGFGVAPQLSFGATNGKMHFPFTAFIRCFLFFFSLAVSRSPCSLYRCRLHGERGAGCK